MDRFNKFVVLTMVAAVVAFVFVGQRSGHSQEPQNTATNKTSEPPTNKGSEPTKRGFGGLKGAPPKIADVEKLTWDLPADADKTKNAVEATTESIAKGKELYFARAGNCVFCHGESGSGNEENLPKLRRKPADLSDKTRMRTMTDGELFWKITLGIPGIMPGREKQLTEEERWHVVNYIRTLAQEKPMN